MFSKADLWPLEKNPKYLLLLLFIVVVVRFVSTDLITAQVEPRNFNAAMPEIQVKKHWVDTQMLAQAWPAMGSDNVPQLNAENVTVNADRLQAQGLQVRFLGVFQQAEQWWAVLQITQGNEQKIKAVKTGDDVAGILINTISKNSVEIELAGKPHKLMLFKSPERN